MNCRHSAFQQSAQAMPSLHDNRGLERLDAAESRSMLASFATSILHTTDLLGDKIAYTKPGPPTHSALLKSLPCPN